MRQHPRPRAGKTFCSGLAEVGLSLRWLRAAAATGAVPRTSVGTELLRRMGAALVGGEREPALRRHSGKIWSSQEGARCHCAALRTLARQVALRHGPHLRERTAIFTLIIVSRHHGLPGGGQPTGATMASSIIAPVDSAERSRGNRITANPTGFTDPATSAYRHLP